MHSFELARWDNKWYSDSIEEVSVALQNYGFFQDHYAFFKSQLNNDYRRIAYLVAAKNHFFFNYLPRNNIINYERFAKNNNVELNVFLEQLRVNRFDFSNEAELDWNVIGKPFKKVNREEINFSCEDQMFFKDLFAPLQELGNEKFGILRVEYE